MTISLGYLIPGLVLLVAGAGMADKAHRKDDDAKPMQALVVLFIAAFLTVMGLT